MFSSQVFIGCIPSHILVIIQGIPFLNMWHIYVFRNLLGIASQ